MKYLSLNLLFILVVVARSLESSVPATNQTSKESDSDSTTTTNGANLTTSTQKATAPATTTPIVRDIVEDAAILEPRATLTSHSDSLKIIRPNENKIGYLPVHEHKVLKKNQLLQNLVKINEEHIQYVRIEDEATNATNLPIETNAFISAVHLAYSHHLPLVITPDMIWYLITSSFAVHINKNAELLRQKFVEHEGKKLISVRRDHFVFNSSTGNPWNEVIDEFSVKIGEQTRQNMSALFTGNFSTSSTESSVVSKIVLMDAMQKYFEYEVVTLCGIPEIRIKGTKKDWISIIERTGQLIGLVPALEPWAGTLFEILQNFIDIYEDKINQKFWNEIYKVRGGSGGPYLNGWAIGLFPYLKFGEKNYYVWEKTWRDAYNSTSFGSGLTTSRFPIAINKVPFKWTYLNQEVDMIFLGGLLSVRYDLNDFSLTPVFGYAITEDKIQASSEPNQPKGGSMDDLVEFDDDF